MNLKSTSEICCLCVWHAFRFVNVLYSNNQFLKKCYRYLKGKNFIIAYTMMIFEYIEDWHRSYFKFIVYMFNV